MKKFLPLILLISAAAGGYIFMHRPHPAGDVAPPSQSGMMPMTMPVTVAAAVIRQAPEWHEFSGRLQAAEKVDVRPRIDGTIESVHFADGALVKKGDLLFKIDPRPFDAAVRRAEATLNAAKADIATAASDRARAERLIKDKAIPQREFDEIKNRALTATARVQAADAELTSARLNLEYTNITAPIDGRASRAEITAGNVVQGSMNPPVLSTLVSQDPIYADFDMDEQTYLSFIKTGALASDGKIPVTLQLADNSGGEYSGAIQSFDNHLDPASGTVRVRAVFNNADGALIPGLFAHLKLGTPALKPYVLISDRAINTDQDRKFVYVVNDKNTVEYRPVKPGALIGGLRVIEQGLAAGEKIVVRGTQRVHPGSPVMPTAVAMEDADKDTPAPEKPAQEGQEKH